MYRIMIVFLFVFAFAIPGNAQTTTSTVNADQVTTYTFTAAGETQDITVSWKNPNAKLFLVLVCNNAAPLAYGIADGGIDRFARLVAGVPSGYECALGISSHVEGSVYNLNVSNSVDAVVAAAGSVNDGGVTPTSFSGVSNVTLALEQTIANLR